MSLMRMTCPGVNFAMDLKVIGFESPLAVDMKYGQTQEMVQYWPHKATQQEIRFRVVCSSTEEYTRLQKFVRASQMWAVRTVENPEVTLYWPERGIDNWTGLITNFQAGDDRFNFAPKANLSVKLVDSLLSQKTWSLSFGEEFRKFFETDIGFQDPTDPGGGDSVIVPPTTTPGGIDLIDPFGLINRGNR